MPGRTDGARLARAAAFEMRVLYHQRTPLSAAEESSYRPRYAPLDNELLRGPRLTRSNMLTPELGASVHEHFTYKQIVELMYSLGRTTCTIALSPGSKSSLNRIRLAKG